MYKIISKTLIKKSMINTAISGTGLIMLLLAIGGVSGCLNNYHIFNIVAFLPMYALNITIDFLDEKKYSLFAFGLILQYAWFFVLFFLGNSLKAYIKKTLNIKSLLLRRSIKTLFYGGGIFAVLFHIGGMEQCGGPVFILGLIFMLPMYILSSWLPDSMSGIFWPIVFIFEYLWFFLIFLTYDISKKYIVQYLNKVKTKTTPCIK